MMRSNLTGSSYSLFTLAAVNRLVIATHAEDPITLSGVIGSLDGRPDFAVVRFGQHPKPDVLVVCSNAVTGDILAMLRRVAAGPPTRVVLVTSHLRDVDVLPIVECGVVSVLPTAAATPERLCRSVLAAANGRGELPPSLLGSLLSQLSRLQRDVLRPKGLIASGLAERELDVLRLMADGFDTNEIAGKLCYSERTVKNVIYGVTHRLKLRNRSHAVAYALRAGMI